MFYLISPMFLSNFSRSLVNFELSAELSKAYELQYIKVILKTNEGLRL